ncbi:MAG: proline--tRNA ligase [Candidatus Parcubacteria bacterium]|nr:MAG: proline--tRNA ligase [Candidatus Parcubacteria bacterium]
MRQSQLFTHTRREAPRDEASKNAQLLIRAGYIHKEMAGVYSFLPLGWRVLENIMRIIREEMNAIGGQEVHLSALQSRALWEQTDRWSDEKVDIWFKTTLAAGGEVGLAPTHEEPITAIMREHIASYRDLPQLPYQIQLKFRNELRARSGLMRGREFFMKDMYTFARTEKEHEELYERVKQAYFTIFRRLGLGDRTYLTFASGGIFSRYSHEFQTVADIGEDTIYLDKTKGIAVNKEVLEESVLADLGLEQDKLEEVRAVEVGNIFSLGTRFSKALGCVFKDAEGKERHPIMGCYGIGPNRLMGLIAELFADERGLVWPKTVAPYSAHIVALSDEPAVKNAAEKVYQDLQQANIEVCYDDRDGVSAGEKLSDADLLGIPLQLRVGLKSLKESAVDVFDRATGEERRVPLTQISETVKSAI